MSRRWLIGLSLVAHVGLGIVLFVTGIWRIERLDYRHKAALSLGVMLPQTEPEGGSPEPQRPKAQKPREVHKVVPKVPTQPVPVKPDEAPNLAASTLTTGTGGDGTGSGSGTGPGSGVPGGVTCDDAARDGASQRTLGSGDRCVGPLSVPPPTVCGNSIRETGEACDDGNLAAGDGCSTSCKLESRIIPPTVLQGLRISGDTQVHPPDLVKTAMLRDGKDRITGVIKLCVATDGGVSSVSVVASTKYADYDSRLVAATRGWRYRPYTLDGRPVPVCGMVTFVYTIH